jgi:hypothetical protein
VPVLTLMAEWELKHHRRKSRLSTDAVARQPIPAQNDSRAEESA